MMTYQQAATLCARSGSKRLENNTRLVKIGDDYAVILHSTAVVTIHPDNSYTLRSGGWKTVTTKDRINKYGPVRIWQKKFVWYVGCVEFFDGIRVDASGNVLSPREAA